MNRAAGNVLFLILIVIVLFAALSYAITQGTRDNTGITREKEMIDAALNQQCIASVEQGINRLEIIHGCSLDEISYEIAGGINENNDNPSDTNCFLFHRDGADIAPCGVYTEPFVTTGLITVRGDTATTVLMPSGLYFKCPSWPAVLQNYCASSYSLDGLNFIPAKDICTIKGDGSDGRTGVIFAINFYDAQCDAACGSGNGDVYLHNTVSNPDPTTYYLEDDYTLSSYSGSCNQMLWAFDCECW